MMIFDRVSFYSALQVVDFKHIFKIIHPMKTYCNTLEGCCSIQLSYGQVLELRPACPGFFVFVRKLAEV